MWPGGIYSLALAAAGVADAFLAAARGARAFLAGAGLLVAAGAVTFLAAAFFFSGVADELLAALLVDDLDCADSC